MNERGKTGAVVELELFQILASDEAPVRGWVERKAFIDAQDCGAVVANQLQQRCSGGTVVLVLWINRVPKNISVNYYVVQCRRRHSPS